MTAATHQDNDLAGSKTASRIFFADPPHARPVWPSQVTETHLESVTYVYRNAPGCVVAPNNAAWDAQFAKDTQPNRLLASNGIGSNGAVFGPGGVYVKPAPSPVIPQGPLNGSGNGVVVEGIAGYYVLVGGGGGSSTVRLENGTVATYAVGQVGIGLGGKGAGIQGGKVWGVFQPSDYGGPFLNISANFGVGVSLSVWPNGSAGITFGPAPGAGISASLQWYEPTSVFPAPQQPPPQTSSPSNKGPN